MTDLIGFVEKHAEVGENHPELLPAIGVLKLPEQITTDLVLKKHNHLINITIEEVLKTYISHLKIHQPLV